MALRFMCRLEPNKIVLQEMGDKKVSWVQLFRKGQWKHPKYGPLKFTDEIFGGFIKNFNDRVRKIDIAIDAEHEPEKGACGWIKQVEARADSGLWALVEWTSRGLSLVADGAFKYLSGDFDYEWKDDETGKKYQNVLFGAALTNRPFIKGMSPINLSEFLDELEKDEDVRNAFQLAEDILKLKEGEGKMKTDAEIKACKNEADLSPAELARKKEMMKEEEVLLAKKKLADRAKAVGLAEDAVEADIVVAEAKKTLSDRAIKAGLKTEATEAEVVAKEKELSDAAIKEYSARCVRVGLKEPVEKTALEAAEVALKERAKKIKLSETATLVEVLAAEKVGNENEQSVKVAVALGLGADATLDQIYAAASKFVLAVKGKIQGSARTMSERAKTVGLTETATEIEVVAKEKELSEKRAKDEIDAILASDVPALEKKLSEMKTKGADALTVRLLEETIASKKKLHEVEVTNRKEKIELKLKEHFKAGKLTAKERDILKAILFSEVEAGETSFKLSEKDKDGKDVEATKTLGEIIDAILNDRPAIIELKELAAKELKEPPKEPSKEMSEEEAGKVGSRVARKVTGSSKTAKQLAERAKKVGLPATATLAEIELKEKEGKK